MSEALARVREAASYLSSQAGVYPSIGLILGSGLASIAEEMESPVSVPFSEIPHCPVSTVPGHLGQLRFGLLAGKPVATLVGRLHFYEGYSMSEVVFPVRLLEALGCRTLIVTNAAGGLNPLFWPGDLMAITDHINFLGLGGHNPLSGRDGEAFGPRFVDLRDAYDPDLLDIAVTTARGLGIDLRRGVYAMAPGPNYETPAELRMLQTLGADAVGMSTVPEVLAARQLGMRVLGISCITNLATVGSGKVSHRDVLNASLAAGPLFANLIREVVRRL